MNAGFNVRSDPTPEAGLAAIFDRNRFGMAMAAIIKMIATTINSSISEKPFCLLRIFLIPPTPPVDSGACLYAFKCTAAAMSAKPRLFFEHFLAKLLKISRLHQATSLADAAVGGFLT